MKLNEKLFHSHPRATQAALPETLDAANALSECVVACTLCADACLAEDNVGMMRRCIRSDLDCAEICASTLRLILRQTETVAEIVRQQVHACVIACQLCAEECGRHEHEHCRLCAQTCHHCQEACNRLLGEISSSGVVSAENMESELP